MPYIVRFIPVFIVLTLLCCMPSGTHADTGLAKQVFQEMNVARTDPRSYAGFLREFRRQFQGKMYRLPGSSRRMMTEEGTAAVDEAIRFLSRQKSLPPLVWSTGLAAAAAELARDEGKSGDVGHNGRQSGGMQERIERHGTWSGGIGENISYGHDEARLVVIQLIVDDGVPDRGHRRNLFNSSTGTAGVACGSHPRFRSMCVIDMAGRFRE